MATDNDFDRGIAQDNAVMLEVLSAVERDSSITQRSLSRELGIALGLGNAYLKRCAKKGLIKVRQAPLNRYAYYLTPKGFAEKSRLVARYLSVSLNFFRDARDQCESLFGECENDGMLAIALAGEGELAEIAILSTADIGVEILCIIDGNSEKSTCAGMLIVADLEAARTLANGKLDGVIVTDVRAPQATYEAICSAAHANGLPVGRVLAPDILRITRTPARQRNRSVG